jgi:hypothetical protein
MSTTNNPMDLPNVHAPENEGSSGEYRVVSPLAEVIWELALKNPMWTFKGTKTGSMLLSNFTISQSWETLGSIERSYNSRSGRNGVEILNHRLQTRDNIYKTADAAKAIAKVKKTFKPRSVLEIAAVSKEKADTVVSQEHYGKEREARKYQDEIKQRAIDYVIKGPGYDLFLEYAKQRGDKSVANHLEMMQTAKDELSTIEGIKTAMGAKKSALIVVDAGKYLVKIDDNVQLYDDTTLPVKFREKLGLLKLVNEKQFVTDVGCRVNKEIYVLKLDEQTEGEIE